MVAHAMIRRFQLIAVIDALRDAAATKPLLASYPLAARGTIPSSLTP
jgi:hypothetical protein